MFKDKAWRHSFYFFFFLNHYAPVQSVKLTDVIWLLQLAISSLSFMHWVTRVKPPLRFEPGSPGWEVDDLPTELFLPPGVETFLIANWYVNIHASSYERTRWMSVSWHLPVGNWNTQWPLNSNYFPIRQYHPIGHTLHNEYSITLYLQYVRMTLRILWLYILSICLIW